MSVCLPHRVVYQLRRMNQSVSNLRATKTGVKYSRPRAIFAEKLSRINIKIMIKLLLLGLAVQLLWHPLSYFCDQLSRDHEISTNLLNLDKKYNHIMKWDALFYYEIATQGYRSLKNHAFSYGLPFLFNSLGQNIPLYLVVQKFFNLANILLAYKLTKLVRPEIATQATIFFIFSPAQAYFHSLYTETFFTFMTFLGVYLQLTKQRLMAAIVLSSSQFFRSNGLFYIVFSGLPVLLEFLTTKKGKLKPFVLGVAIGIIYLLPFALSLWIPYKNYCKIYNGSWCQSLVPNAYSYIQEKFWDVGFLHSYQPQKLVKIITGVQGVAVQFYGLWKFRSKSADMIGLYFQQWILFLIVTFMAHVNCSSRFFGTTIVFYWTLAELYQWHRYKVLYYLIEFHLGGLVLFSNFFLWA